MTDTLLEISDVAAAVKMSARWVGDQVRKGAIPHLRLGERAPGRRDTRPVRFTTEQLDAIVAQYKVEPPAPSRSPRASSRRGRAA